MEEEVGSLVWVEGGSSSMGQPIKDSGVILQVGCSYDDHETGALCSNGIMVKLQISNTRGIFAPSQVTPMSSTTTSSTASSSVATTRQNQRPSRKLRSQVNVNVNVTPSPDLLIVKDKDTNKVQNSVTHDDDDDAGAGGTRTVQKEKRATKPRPKRTSKIPAAAAKEKEETKAQDPMKVPPRQKKAAAKRKPKDMDVDVAESINVNVSVSVSAASVSSTDELGRPRGDIVMATLPNDRERHILSDSDSDKEKETPLVPLKQKKPKASTAKAKATTTTKTTTQKKTPKKETTVSNNKKKKKDPKLLLAQESDSDDEKDRPFRIEYSVTGRATCKTCDDRIPQGELRVGHRPLFRGKPGFVVYRHLQCALFSDPISKLEHVGGYRRLTSDDQLALTERIDASLALNDKEDDELHADELVPAVFQGDMRQKPPGFVGTLLPFQQEGVSWMYHQERNLPELRGGILADEMGMVRNRIYMTTRQDTRHKR